MKITLPEKFSDKQLDEFMDGIYKNILKNKKDTYCFDFSKTEWISNQNTTVLQGLLSSFTDNNIDFTTILFDPDIPIENIEKRNALQIVQLWETYRLSKIIPESKLFSFIQAYQSKIDQLKQIKKINLTRPELFQKHEITPIIFLDYINNYKDKEIEELIKDYYLLSKANVELISENDCAHPFINETLGQIICKELYENYLDHYKQGIFSSLPSQAYMSLILHSKISDKFPNAIIQENLEKNFILEALPESKDFFYDFSLNKYKNNAYIQFTFLDFGIGIVETLRSEHLKQFDKTTDVTDYDILEYAFHYDSSRYPIEQKYQKDEIIIPRGLFDILTMVQRYNGMIVARSNYGKIMYDFSQNKSIDSAKKQFGDASQYFPGTLITIYLPALKKDEHFDSSVIKPIIIEPEYKVTRKKHVSLYQIINDLQSDKKNLYSNLINEVHRLTNDSHTKKIVYFSYRNSNLDNRLTRKLIYFLLTDYAINNNNNIIILHPPDQKLLEEIHQELLGLSQVIKNHKIHPLPFIFFEEKTRKVKLFWLGIFDEDDKNKLNKLLSESFYLTKSDFNEPENLIGHINYFDSSGDLKTNLPNYDQIINYYENEYQIADKGIVERIISRNKCLLLRKPNIIYLHQGDYYTYEHLNWMNLLVNKMDCQLITQILFDKIIEKISDLDDYYFIGISSGGEKIIDQLIEQGLVSEHHTFQIDTYNQDNLDKHFKKILPNKKYILICDEIATGYKTHQLIKKMESMGIDLNFIAVIANSIDAEFEESKLFNDKYSEKLIFLYTHPIKKHRRTELQIKKDIVSKTVIRINPILNTPIIESLNTVWGKNNIMLSNSHFLKLVSDDQIKIGYLLNNNLIHPFFFDTHNILKSNGEKILDEILKFITPGTKNLAIFFPKHSGMTHIKIKYLRNKVFKDHSVEKYEMERFVTDSGWKFLQVFDFHHVIKNHSILILDDGSCSGDSIIQMINQIAIYYPKEIYVLSLIGRVSDFKQEFFTMISKLIETIGTKIYFGTHWHIPTYYLDSNPNSVERKWLQEIVSILNIPQSIKKIVDSIYFEMIPKDFDEFKDYKFLPKSKQGRLEIPKKDLILVRNEIGKVVGMRFYKESFHYFDNFMIKYETYNESPDRYKDIELFSALLTYEPYLIHDLCLVLPDVISKVKEFIVTIIFGNPQRQNKTLEVSELYYNWSKFDLVHLFFIVYQNDELVAELSNDQKIFQLLNFLSLETNGTSYIFYKLLTYFPLKKSEFEQKHFDKKIFKILLDYSKKETIFKNELKRFLSFLSSLPNREDLDSQLQKLSRLYEIQGTSKLHDEMTSLSHNISIFVKYIRRWKELLKNGEKATEDLFSNLIAVWHNITEFLNPILSFASTYPDYLVPYPFDILSNEIANKLRTEIGNIEEIIYEKKRSIEIDAIDKLYEIITHIEKTYDVDSDFHKLFKEQNTNVNEFILKLKEKFKQVLSKEAKIINDDLIPDELIVNIPLFYSEKLIKDEIINNLAKYWDFEENGEIKLNIEQKQKSLSLKIENTIKSDKQTKNTGQGLKSLEALSKIKYFNFKYKHTHDNKHFFQELVFNL